MTIETRHPTAQELINAWTRQEQAALAAHGDDPRFKAEVETTEIDMTTILEAVREGKIPIGTVAHLLSLNLVDAKEQARESDQRSLTDHLTNLYNRAGYDRRIEEELREAQRIKEPVSLAVIDLDCFKGVNDTFGHPTGDTLLQIFAAEFQERIRGSDIACRFGGDEFALIMQHTDIDGAKSLFDKLFNDSPATGSEPAKPPLMETVRAKFTEETDLLLPTGFNMSVGISSTELVGYNPKKLLASADQALYSAKRQGKGTYAIASKPIPEHLSRRSLRTIK